GEDTRSDSVKRIKLSDRLQLVLQIAKHESDEALRLAPLVTGRVAGLNGGECQSARNDHSGERRRSQHREFPLTPDLIAPNEIVEADPEHAGHQFQETEAPRFGIASQVGSERFCRNLGRTTSPV